MAKEKEEEKGRRRIESSNSAVCITVNSSFPPSENGTASFTVPTRPNHSAWTFSPTTFFQAYAPPLCINLSICLFYLSQTSTRSCRHTQMPPPFFVFCFPSQASRVRFSFFLYLFSMRCSTFILSVTSFFPYLPSSATV